MSGGGSSPYAPPSPYYAQNGSRGQPATTSQPSFPGSGSAIGQPFASASNWGSPGTPNPEALRLAQSLHPEDNNKLMGLLGESGAHQYANMYGPMGTMSNGNAIMDQYRGENGNTGGIADLTAGTRATYEQNGVIANGQWAKKMDNNGQWVPV